MSLSAMNHTIRMRRMLSATPWRPPEFALDCVAGWPSWQVLRRRDRTGHFRLPHSRAGFFCPRQSVRVRQTRSRVRAECFENYYSISHRGHQVPSGEMRFYVKNLHWLDAMTPPLESHLTRLVETVSMFLGAEKEHRTGSRKVLCPAHCHLAASNTAQNSRCSDIRWCMWPSIDHLWRVGGSMLVDLLRSAIIQSV